VRGAPVCLRGQVDIGSRDRERGCQRVAACLDEEPLSRAAQVLQAPHDARIPPADGPPMPTGLKVAGSSGVRPLSIEQRPSQDLASLGVHMGDTATCERGDQMALATSLAFAALDQSATAEECESPGTPRVPGGLASTADTADASFFSHLPRTEPLDLDVDHPPEVLKLEIQSLRQRSEGMSSEVEQLRKSSKELRLKLSEAEARIFALEGQLRCFQGAELNAIWGAAAAEDPTALCS